jgi:hypothetical protein
MEIVAMRESLVSRITVAFLAFMFTTMIAVNASAFPFMGAEVDQYCTANGRTPSMPYNNDCAICHNPVDAGADRTPLFQAYKDGDFDAFCPPSANSPPSFLPIGDHVVSENGLLTLDIVASDPDGDLLILEAAGLPTGALFEDLGSGLGRFVWMPSFDQGGTYAVTFKVTDDGSPPESAMEQINISVGNVNRPPTLDPIGAQTVAVDSILRISLSSSDPDGDALEFGSSGLPDAALLTDFGDGTGEISWTPTAGDVGSVTVTVSVTDGGIPMESDAEEFVITVGGVNQPPVLDPIGDRVVKEGESWTIGLTGSDPNGDALRFECEGVPAGTEILDAGNGSATLRGSAGFNDAGNYGVTCSVFDSAVPPATDFESFTLTIGDVNRPPVLDPIAMTKNGESIVLRLTAQDPDGNGVFYEAMGVPSGAEFVDYGDGTAELFWTPPTGTVGDFVVDFTVFDDGEPSESASADFTISLVAPELKVPAIRQARWNSKRGVLQIAGGGAHANETIQIVDAVTGAAVAEATADRRGKFRAQLRLDGSGVPCAVSALGSDGMGDAKTVDRAPAGCSVN